MYNDPNMMNQSGGNTSIAPGTDVYDVNGDKVGSVQQFLPQANCLCGERSQEGCLYPGQRHRQYWCRWCSHQSVEG